MKYISGEEILVIHSDIIEMTGGRHGVRDIRLLASILEKPKTHMFGLRPYKTVYEKAAVYLESIAQYHVFIDGNKRTAIATAAYFLFKNNRAFHANNRIVVSFALKVANKAVSFDEIVVWIKKHSA